MVQNILLTALFIIIGFVIIKAAKESFAPLMEHWFAGLLRRLAGDKGVKVFYYIAGTVIILFGIIRLIYIINYVYR